MDEIVATRTPPAPPGTEQLFVSRVHDANNASDLQFITDHSGNHILLIPQPSLTDPNDPLRWSRIKKWAALANGVGYAFMGSVTGPIMAAGMIPLTETFGVSLQKMTYANGATLICQGVGNIFWMPLAVKIGRRPVYMASNLLMGVACVWLGLASTASYVPLLVGRAFLGLFEAPIESIVPSTITDLFFLHDRGEKVSFYGLSVLGGNELGPLFSALIIQHLGMNWAFFIVAMFIGLNAVTMFFFMPETKYTGVRPSTAFVCEQPKQHEVMIENVSAGKHNRTNEVESASPSPPKKSFIRELALWERPDPSVSLLKTFLRPFILLTYPTVLWSCLTYGMALGWNVVIGASTAQLFAPPPYLFDSQAQGLVFLSPFIGSLIGSWLCGSLSDTVANYFTKRNDGVREPEMRLPICALAAFLTFFGALMAGLCYHYKTHWAGPVIGFGVLTTGAQMGVSLSMSYALDCHQELSVELMVTIASVKSLIAWIWTWVINDWIISDGMLVVFMSIATVNVVVNATTFVMYFYGKRIRSWIHEKDLFTKLNL